ncbi:MAG: hypothetical protein ACNA7E_10865, partial [Wenzhouxiangellaceae bacterium]
PRSRRGSVSGESLARASETRRTPPTLVFPGLLARCRRCRRRARRSDYSILPRCRTCGQAPPEIIDERVTDEDIIQQAWTQTSANLLARTSGQLIGGLIVAL